MISARRSSNSPGREPALLHRALVVLLDDRRDPVERLLRGLQHRHRHARVGEVHGDAAAHGAGADHGHRSIGRVAACSTARRESCSPRAREERVPQRLDSGVARARRSVRARTRCPCRRLSAPPPRRRRCILSGAGKFFASGATVLRANSMKPSAFGCTTAMSRAFLSGSLPPAARLAEARGRPATTSSSTTRSSSAVFASSRACTGLPPTIMLSARSAPRKARQTLRPAGARQEAELHFRQPELRAARAPGNDSTWRAPSRLRARGRSVPRSPAWGSPRRERTDREVGRRDH